MASVIASRIRPMWSTARCSRSFARRRSNAGTASSLSALQTTYAATSGGSVGADGSTPKPPEAGVSVRGDSPARRSSAVTRSTMLSSVTQSP
jgi:hypothetical protein